MTLLERLRGDEQAAWTELRSRVLKIARLCLARLGIRDIQRIDEASNASVLRIRELLQKGKYQERGAFWSWIKTVVHFTCRRQLDRPTGQSEMSNVDLDAIAVESTPPIETLLTEELRAILGECMEKLEQFPRQLLIAFYWKGQALEDMAVESKRPLGTIKSYLHRARQNIKNCMATKLGYGDLL